MIDPSDPVAVNDSNVGGYKFKILKELTKKSDIIKFNKRAKNGRNNAFVIYFAHWCPHCQMLTPELIKLDKFLYKNRTKLSGPVARVSDEHVRELEVFNQPNGFPTIVILDGNGEKKKDFNGSRTMEGFLTFLKNNGVYGGGGSSMSGGKKTKKAKKFTRKHTRKTRKH